MSAAYDLIIIGGGMAGLTAAGRASQAGLRVGTLADATGRAVAEPGGELLEFLERTDEAEADLAKWDRAPLERAKGGTQPPTAARSVHEALI